MFTNRATLRKFNRRLGQSLVRDLPGNPAQHLTAVRPCNDNQPVRSAASLRRQRRPMLFCRWRKTPGGALECVWHTEPQAAGAGEEPSISRSSESLRQSIGAVVLRRAIGVTPQFLWRIGLAPLSIARLSADNDRWNFTSSGCARLDRF
jgi:hypothetical protein